MTRDRTLSYPGTTGAREPGLAVSYLVLALESARPLAPPSRIALTGVDEVALGRGDHRARTGDAQVAVTVPDEWMSSRHAALGRRGDGWEVRDCGSKNGTRKNGSAIAGPEPLADGDVLEVGGTIAVFRRTRAAPAEIARLDADRPAGAGPLETYALDLERELGALHRIAPSGVPVLVSGETGTGKELAARAVHALSGRRGPLRAVNCGALPDTLVESELFGSRRGAYSGAIDRPGLVRAADGGTLFLDEVAELPEPSQVKLLRVLQEREVVPLGDTRPIPVDLRVVAATSRDLAALVDEGRFRGDLYARLAGLSLELPPLRRRREDIGLIAAAVLRRVAGDRAPAITLRRSAARALVAHDWPHNVRELEQALAAAVALANGRPIAVTDLPPPVRGAAEPASGLSPDDRALRDRLAAALAAHGGNVSAVAREMGRARVQIRRWCKRLDLDPAAFRRPGR